MKTLFKVSPLTYIILFSALLCGYFNYVLIILTILFIHDLGHIILMKIYKINIYEISILPFGSIIKSDINYNIKSIKQFFISSAGILAEIILFFLFSFLYQIGLINDISYNIFFQYNKLIIFFNILPIIPLDGSKILLSLIENILPYKLCLKVVNICSLIWIILFIYFNKMTFNLILIGLFLFLKTYEEILNHKLIFNKFLIERCLYNFNYKKVKYVKDIKLIFKNRLNIINYESETKVLKEKFKYI